MTKTSFSEPLQAFKPTASERLVWDGSPSQFGNIKAYAVCALVSLTVVGLLWSIPFALWTYLSTKNTRFELTNQRLILHGGVFTRTQDQVELYRVRDVKFIQPFVLRFFSVANVLLVSSDEINPYILIGSIENAQQVMESVRTATEAARALKRVRVAEIE